MEGLRDQLNKFPFEMEIPDEPYLDNFSQNKSITAYYVGDRYLKSCCAVQPAAQPAAPPAAQPEYV